MENDRKFRALAIAAICIAVVGVSVAYAALATTLTITGTATVDTDASWNVHWDSAPSVTDKTNSVSVTGPSIVGNNLTWAATVTAPGDTFTINAKIVNDGTLAAKLNGGSDIAITGELADYFKTETKMTINGAAIASQNGKVLKGKGTGAADFVDVKIVVKFTTFGFEVLVHDDASTDKTVKFVASIPFVQAADSETDYFNA